MQRINKIGEGVKTLSRMLGHCFADFTIYDRAANRNVIISDGLVVPYQIIIGRTMAGEFKNVYLDAQKAGKIHRTL